MLQNQQDFPKIVPTTDTAYIILTKRKIYPQLQNGYTHVLKLTCCLMLWFLYWIASFFNLQPAQKHLLSSSLESVSIQFISLKPQYGTWGVQYNKNKLYT